MRLPWRRGERASSLDLLVVGLGNPGREYAGNRHNVGFMVVDELARRHGGTWRGKFYGRLAEVRIDGHRVALLEPETFMNESGRSVAGRCGLLQARARRDPRRPRRERPRTGAAPGAARRRPRRPQRAALGRAAPRHARVPAPAGRRRPPGPRRPAQPRRLRPRRLRARTRTPTRSSRGPPTRSRRSTPRGSRPRSAASTDRFERFAGSPERGRRYPGLPASVRSRQRIPAAACAAGRAEGVPLMTANPPPRPARSRARLLGACSGPGTPPPAGTRQATRLAGASGSARSARACVGSRSAETLGARARLASRATCSASPTPGAATRRRPASTARASCASSTRTSASGSRTAATRTSTSGCGCRAARCSPATSSSSTASATSACTSAAAASSTRLAHRHERPDHEPGDPWYRASYDGARRVLPARLASAARRAASRGSASRRFWRGSRTSRQPRRGLRWPAPEPPFRAFAMDRPILYPLVERLRADERLPAFAAALPTRARVAEPALPLLLAALHEELGRGLCVLAPRGRRRARRSPRRSAGSSASERVGLLPSRGVGVGSGLEPPPHLVGERARALEVLAARRARLRLGARARRADAAARGAAGDRCALARGDEPGIDGLAEALALAGYERVERVEERGQFAVRGGLVDVFPSTGPRAAAGSSSSATRSRASAPSRPSPSGRSREVDEATIYPAAERRARRLRARRCRARRRAAPSSRRPRAALAAAARPRLAARRGARRLARGGRSRSSRSTGAAELDPLPQGQPLLVRRPAPGARRRAGLAEAENELLGLLRQGLDVVVAFAHRGEAERQRPPAAPRRGVDRSSPGEAPAGLAFAVAPARRGFVWRELGLALLPDTQVFRRRPPRATAPAGRALASFSDLRSGDYVVHEDHGIARCSASRRGRSPGVTRDYLLLGFRGDDRVYVPHEQIGKVSRYIGADVERADALQARRQAPGTTSRAARAQHLREMAGELLALYAAAPDAARDRLRRRARVARAARGRLPLPRDRGPGARDRGGQGGPRGAAADGPARLRRRRLRQDRGGAARGLRRRRRRQAGADARPDDDPRPAALEHLPRALPRLPGPGRDGLALPQARRGQARCSPSSARARSTS